MAAQKIDRKSAVGRISIVHMTVIGLSLLMTLGAWQFSKVQIEMRTQTQFDKARDQALNLITERMKKYEDALWAGVASVKSHGDDISRDEWRVFSETLKIDEKYPGISGIGMIHYLNESNAPAYLAKRRTERPEFRIHPEHLGQDYLPISFIEPEASNLAAVGLDVAHETNRRNGALASRDTGKAQITGPIFLVQDDGHTPGFLFYAPLYKNSAPTTVAERRESILGAVYAPFVTRKLMAGLLAKDRREIRFSITDGEELIYDEHVTDDPLYDADPMYSEQMSLEVYGRTWTFDVRSNLAFRASNSYAQPTFILLAGLLIEALIISLLLMMSRANNRAVSYADEVTRELQEESEKLAKSNINLANMNKELEEFAYIASHDLKTPIRGIGGLAELLQDDLEEYLASPNANPDVGLNIERIQDRVTRMNQLMKGVLDFSRVGAARAVSDPLDMTDFVETIVSDFDLDADQIQLSGDVVTVHTDTVAFRRALENLIGNAIKYHDGEKRLEIKITSRIKADRCWLSVADNGPGIDPYYHEKIFEMFKTLSLNNAPDSTGIGLAIVKKIVERNDGKVFVESTEGVGATFTFDWPHQEASVSFDEYDEAA